LRSSSSSAIEHHVNQREGPQISSAITSVYSMGASGVAASSTVDFKREEDRRGTISYFVRQPNSLKYSTPVIISLSSFGSSEALRKDVL
jgi:hypothetical protein